LISFYFTLRGLHPLCFSQKLYKVELECVEKTLAERHDELAAVITEPVMCNNDCILPEPGYLEGLRDLCNRYGIALIFDEIITGFRLGVGGAQAYFGVTPDLAVFGKAMASGYPISVLAGRKQWMQPIADGKVIHAGTMNSANACVAAALATIEVLEREKVHAQLFTLGRRLMKGLQQIAQDADLPLLVQGPGPMFHVGFTTQPQVRDYRGTFSYDKARYARFIAEMHNRGIRLIGRGLWYISAAHTTEEIDYCIQIARETLEEM
jgi:glutamate-1-semialdehyde 2,1-aminomutase